MIRLPIIALFLGVLSSCCSYSIKSPRPAIPEIHHVVLLWFKPEYRTDSVIQRIKRETLALKDTGEITSIKVGEAIQSERAVVDDSFDLAVMMTFSDSEAMNRYLSAPAHKEFVKRYIAGKTERLTVYDF